MMRLKLRHVAGFRYSAPVEASYNEARVLPVDHLGQTVLSSRLSTRPRAPQYTYTDYFGSQVVAFEILSPHTQMTVEARCLVENDRSVEHLNPVDWEPLRAMSTADIALIEQIQQTRRTMPPQEVLELAQAAYGRGESPHETAESICMEIQDRMAYVPGATQVTSTAEEAWAQGKGVCQDITHIALGALRSVGIPARYISGYLHPSPDPQIGVSVPAESHAWLEYHCGQWVGFDPTNGCRVGDRHILVARGRDYDDIAPIRGVYSGEGKSTLFATVDVTRVA